MLSPDGGLVPAWGRGKGVPDSNPELDARCCTSARGICWWGWPWHEGCYLPCQQQLFNLVLPDIIQNDLILLNITHGPVTMLTTFLSLLTCLSFLAGRSIGSSSCPFVPVATRRGRRIWCCTLVLFHLEPASRGSRSSDSVPGESAAAAAVGLFIASAFFVL